MSEPSNPQEATLDQLRDYVDLARHQGVVCPVCHQLAKVYRRPLNSQMARSLIAFYNAGAANDFVHGPSVVGRWRADEAKLRYWDLIVESDERRADGGRKGWWMITHQGSQFVRGTLSIQKYALIYDGVCVGFDDPFIDIHQALNNRFDYAALMAGERG